MQIPATDSPAKIVKAFHYTLAAYTALVLLQLLWHGYFSLLPLPTRLIICVVSVVPLLTLSRGLLQGNPRSFVWLDYLVLFYFCHGVAYVFDKGVIRQLAMAEVILTSVIFICAALFARWQGRENKILAKSAESNSKPLLSD